MRFGLYLGFFLLGPQPTHARQDSPDTHPLSPNHLPRHPSTFAPTNTPAHHWRIHRQNRSYQRSTHDCGSGDPPAARILATRAPFFPIFFLGFFESGQVCPKFLYGFCCLKCIEGLYCSFRWLLGVSEVVEKPPIPRCVAFYAHYAAFYKAVEFVDFIIA